jgi:hypothetical protein
MISAKWVKYSTTSDKTIRKISKDMDVDSVLSLKIKNVDKLVCLC